jgi:hypothetical protein
MHGIKGIGTALLLLLVMTSAFPAQEASILLEKAIYTEETLGKLNEAISMYQQIVGAADTSRTTAALALYRLGACYRKSGREDEALAAFSRLAQQYPEQKELISKSRMLDLGPAPWADGEVLRLAMKTASLKGENGAYVYSIESAQEAGKAAWKFRDVFVSMGLSLSTATITVVDAQTGLPIRSRLRQRIMHATIETSYDADQVEVSSVANGVLTKKQYPLTGPVYDTGQILPLLRCMPLREEFQTVIPVFGSGVTTNIKVAVLGRETVTVPAGTYDCYKVLLTPENNSQDQTFWLSTDGHFYPIKSIRGPLEYELSSIDVVGTDQPMHIEDSESGISLSAPPLWYFGRISNPPILSLAAPELESAMMLITYAYKPENGPVQKLMDQWIERHQEGGNAYQVRPGSREAALVSGLEGQRCIADTNDPTGGEPLVDYIYLFTSPTKRYVIQFQTDKDNFDKMKPVFESIVSCISAQ